MHATLVHISFFTLLQFNVFNLMILYFNHILMYIDYIKLYIYKMEWFQQFICKMMSGNKKSNICAELKQILHLDTELKSMKLCKYRLTCRFNDTILCTDFISLTAVTWLKYRRHRLKHVLSNQSINIWLILVCTDLKMHRFAGLLI